MISGQLYTQKGKHCDRCFPFLYRCERVRRQRFTQRSTIASTSMAIISPQSMEP